jgi:DNA-binding MarR family transcriptional regulator
MAKPTTREMNELQELGRALWAAQSGRRGELDRELAAAGSTFPQWFALGAIAKAPGSSAHWLAVQTFQSDQAFGTLANRLEAQGLIERTAGEGRKVAHHLTEQGEAMLAIGDAIGDRMLVHSFGDLDADERATLLALLARVGAERPARESPVPDHPAQ